MRPLFAFAFALLFALAGRVVALNIQFGGTIGNITASQLLAIPDGNLKSTCSSQCTPATDAIKTCGDDNDSCLCNNDTATAIHTCEQCMFTELIAENQRMPDPRAGSTPGLGAYAAACLAVNTTIPKNLVTLALPSNWDGPESLHLSLGLTVIAVIGGAVFGIGGLLIMTKI